ncbi:MAG: T9SS type A sorting domain-containing protein [Bacteroidales bacterium]|nr:T9SS type A sorting domain-containing protein [Bacteroidales bacterium]MCF8352678.1 T9SS type A sorting domain-containing protein [Bacteroidales bacterium]MCF8377255.1 T9SS type A sorting domain-containing protein [Bacteroidales bacterium]MCF8401123.1 T9SS type A sorting domain-containing protein [Bacteroidales bacterium]
MFCKQARCLVIPGGAYSELIQYSDGTTKLAINLYDFSTSNYITNTRIYNLPGSIPTSAELTELTQPKPAYPNPANAYVNFDFNHKQKGILLLTDINGREIRKIGIDEKPGPQTINISGLKSGTYLYYIESGGKFTPVRKLIIK